MTGIDQLRQTLGDHATDLVDHDVTVRPAAVHARVRVVRRRRRAAAAGGVAAVVAVIGGIAALPSGDDTSGPAPATQLMGIDVPASLEATGFTYDLDRTVLGDGDGLVRVKLSESDEPRLVSWGTSGADDRVTLDGTGIERRLAYDVQDFSDWYYVSPGSSETLTIRAEGGQAGLAVYTLSDDRPAGITQSGVTFRQQAAGLELVDAVVGGQGESEVTVAGTAPSRGIRLAYFCSGGPATAWLHAATGTDGEVVSGAGCDDRLPFDGLSAGGTSFATSVGEDVTTRFYVTDGENGPIIDSPDLQIGIGMWARTDDESPIGVDGAFPQLIENRGHRWRLVDRQDERGGTKLSVTAPDGSGPVLVRSHFVVGAGSVRTTVDGSPSSTSFAAGSGGTIDDVVNAGSLVVLEVSNGEVRDRDLLAVGTYVRAD